MLLEFLPREAFVYALVFARMGSAMLVLPAIGEAYISERVRLLLGLAVTFVVTPILEPSLPAMPAEPVSLFLLVAGEILVGLFVGTVARILVAAMAVAGTVISFVVGFANAMLFNPTLGDQGALTSVFLSLFAVLMILITDLHHLMFQALVDSYSLFVPGEAPMFGDMADTISRIVARSFQIGMQIAAPFLVVAVIFYTGLGLLARLMPQMQVLFIGMPIQIMLGLFVLAVTLSTSTALFLDYFEDFLVRILIPI